VSNVWVAAALGVENVKLGWSWFFLSFGGMFLYTSGMWLNDLWDREYDLQSNPQRPLVSGQLSVKWVKRMVVMGFLVGMLLCVMGGGAKVGWVILLVGAIVVYDWCHKPWAGSVVVMGACRGLLCLMVASAYGGPGKGVLGLFHAGVLSLYVVGLSLGARPGGFQKKWSVVLVLLLCVVIPAVVVTGFQQGIVVEKQGILFFSVVMLSLGWIGVCVGYGFKGRMPQAIGGLLAGILAVDALFLNLQNSVQAIVLISLIPLLRIWQRNIPAT
jgi:4-hydroxybenzoate polyprenyltransferase